MPAPRMTRPSPLALLLLSALILLTSASTASAAASSVSIWRVSGCTDVGNSTTKCLPSTTITVWGSGFTNSSTQPMNLSITDRWWTRISANAVNMDAQSCTVYLPSTLPLGVWLNVSVTVPTESDLFITSAPYAGLQMWAYPTPTLSSISGCSGSGNVTYDCSPDTAVLVFTGTDLTTLGYPAGVYTSFPGGSRATNFFYNQPSTRNTVNDTCIVLSLADVYQAIIANTHFNGTLQILFAYTNARIFSNALSINIVPLPPPQVLTLLGRSCGNNSLASALQTSDCVGGYSELVLSGHYFYSPFSITVGGLSCYMAGQGSTWFNARYASCQLSPLPGGWYDVNITNAAGTLILPQAVGVSCAPSISAVLSSQCAPDEQSTQTLPRWKCRGGEIITLAGQNLRTDADSVSIAITSPTTTASS